MASPHDRSAPQLTWMLLLLLAPAAVRADTPVAAVRVAPATRIEGTAPRPVQAPRSAEAQALLAVREAGMEQVRALVDQMKSLPEGSSRLRALQLQVVEIKKQNRVQFLHTKANFARLRGDLTVVHELEDQIDQLLNPRPRIETPAAAKPSGIEGGAR